MAAADHRNQVARMQSGVDYGHQLDVAGLDPSIVAEILRILVEEGGLTWKALTRVIELLWKTPTYEQVYARTGGLASVTINNGGKGYTSPPDVTFTGGGARAVGVATLSGDAVTGVTITDYGTGYSSPPSIEFTGGGGYGAAATVNIYNPPFANRGDDARQWTPNSSGEFPGQLGEPNRFTSSETMLDPLTPGLTQEQIDASVKVNVEGDRLVPTTPLAPNPVPEQARLDKERADRDAAAKADQGRKRR